MIHHNRFTFTPPHTWRGRLWNLAYWLRLALYARFVRPEGYGSARTFRLLCLTSIQVIRLRGIRWRHWYLLEAFHAHGYESAVEVTRTRITFARRLCVSYSRPPGRGGENTGRV